MGRNHIARHGIIPEETIYNNQYIGFNVKSHDNIQNKKLKVKYTLYDIVFVVLGEPMYVSGGICNLAATHQKPLIFNCKTYHF